MRVLVTGGAGFIGSHVVDALLARGDDVHVVDDLSNGKRENVPAAATLHVHDIREPLDDDRRRARRPRRSSTSRRRPTCACRSRDPRFDAGGQRGRHDERARGGAAGRRPRRLRLHRRRDLRRVRRGRRPRTRPACRCRRTAPPSSRARGTSARSTGSTGRAHVALRFGNVYGPRQDPARRGRRRRDLPRPAARRASVPRSSATARQTRDYVYVGDVVARDARGTRLRCGRRAQRRHRRRDVRARALRRVPGGDGVGLEPVHEAPRPGELGRSVLDGDRAEKLIGFRPEALSTTGVAATWAWLRSES